jgi:hypothetical protein
MTDDEGTDLDQSFESAPSPQQRGLDHVHPPAPRQATFEDIDQNGDGYITRQEFAAYEANIAAQQALMASQRAVPSPAAFGSRNGLFGSGSPGMMDASRAGSPAGFGVQPLTSRPFGPQFSFGGNMPSMSNPPSYHPMGAGAVHGGSIETMTEPMRMAPPVGTIANPAQPTSIPTMAMPFMGPSYSPGFAPPSPQPMRLSMGGHN